MELFAISYSGMGQAQGIQESVKTETEREQAAVPAGDSVNISPEAREKLRMEKLHEAENPEERDSQGDLGERPGADADKSANDSNVKNAPYDGSSMKDAGGAGGAGGSDPSGMQKEIQRLKEKIEEIKEKLKEAQKELQEAIQEQSAAGPNAEESPAVKAARMEIQALTNQLTQLQEQLGKAMSSGGGGVGGGLPSGGGTRAEGGTGPLEGHVGSGTDPYAAAAAAEAAEG